MIIVFIVSIMERQAGETTSHAQLITLWQGEDNLLQDAKVGGTKAGNRVPSSSRLNSRGSIRM